MSVPVLRRGMLSIAILTVSLAMFGVGDHLVTRWAYAAERGRIDANVAELEQLDTELAQVENVARAFRSVAKVAIPGVVQIDVSGGARAEERAEVRERLREMMPDLSDSEIDRFLRRRNPGSGSGIIFDQAGHILTNNHVVAEREVIRVTLADGRDYRATLVGTDPKTDIAVIKIPADEVHPLRFGDSDRMEVGDWVLAVGAPLGFSHTVTHGIISAVGRSRVGGVPIEYQGFLQTDAAINPGNSGGPLLNLHAEVVGVNTAIATDGEALNAGIAFTIPSNVAANIARRLIEEGEVVRGWIGISMSELSPSDYAVFGVPDTGGILVEAILRDTPAERAGLRVEDVIVSVDGQRVSSMTAFRALVADQPPGYELELDVQRGAEREELTVTLGRQPSDFRRLSRAARFVDVEPIGLMVRTFQPSRARALGFDRVPRGVVVAGKTGDTPFDNSVLESNDIIVAVNDRPVRNAVAFTEAVRAAADERTIELVLEAPSGDRRTVYLKR